MSTKLAIQLWLMLGLRLGLSVTIRVKPDYGAWSRLYLALIAVAVLDLEIWRKLFLQK